MPKGTFSIWVGHQGRMPVRDEREWEQVGMGQSLRHQKKVTNGM